MVFDKIALLARGAAGPATGMATGGIVGANVLPVLGFGAAGVKAGTVAAGIQSVVYGAAVPAGSWFAVATSWGATGAMATPIGFAGAAIGGAVYFAYSRS